MCIRTSSSIVQSHSSTYSKAFLTGLIIAASLVVATNVYAANQLEETTAFGVNAANGAMYVINFDETASIDELISASQKSALSRVEGLAITESLTGYIAYLADTNQSRIWACLELPVLSGPEINCDVVWDPSFGTGPTNPVSIEVLTNGDVIVATAGNSASALSQIWLFPHTGCSPDPATGCLPTGLIAPVLVDPDVKVWFDEVMSGASVRNLEQLHVHTQSGGGGIVSAGDVSVVGFNPSVWLKYSADFLADVSSVAIFNHPLDPADKIDPPTFVPPVTMAFPPGSGPDCSREFVVGEDPGGVATNPGRSEGNKEMLIAVTTGDIQRWDLNGVRHGTSADNCGGALNFENDLGNTEYGLASTVDNGVGKVCISNNNGGIYLLYRAEADGTGTFLTSVTAGVNAPRACEFSALQLALSGNAETTGITSAFLGTTPIELRGFIDTVGLVGVEGCVAEDPRHRGGGVYEDPGSGEIEEVAISEFEGADCALNDSSVLPANLVCAYNSVTDKAPCVLVTVGSSVVLDTIVTAEVLFDAPGVGAAANNCVGPLATRSRQGWTTLTGQGEPVKPANDGFIDDVTVTCNRVRSGTAKNSLHIGPLNNLDPPEDQLTDAIAHLSTVIDGATSLKRKDQRGLKKLISTLNRHISRDRFPQALTTAQQIALNARDLNFGSDGDRGFAIQARALHVGFVIHDGLLAGAEYKFPEKEGFIFPPP